MTKRFITFEGGEGAGKSTQIQLLAAAFKSAGIEAVTTREPGGSKGAEAIRALVVNSDAQAWDAVTESLLFMTARYDHVETLIQPALDRGEWVLCDRFFDSTLVYQGLGKGVGVEWLERLYALLFGPLVPEFTLLLDLDPAQGLARAAARGNAAESRFEKLGLEYHQRLREGFLALAMAEPRRIRVIDAAEDVASIHAEIIAAINERFGLALTPSR